MARIRTIKPEFPQSESVGRLSRDGRLLFVLLLTGADDYGRLRAAPILLARQLYPYDDDAPKLIEKWLSELERHGFIIRYEVEGSRYLEILGWQKHQRVDNAGKSSIPPPSADTRREPPRTAESCGDSPLYLGPRTSTKDLGPADADTLEKDFEEFYSAYPLHKGRGQAEKAYRTARKQTVHATLLAGAKRYAADPSRKTEFTKHAATWLNGKCWLDETPPQSALGDSTATTQGPMISDHESQWRARLRAYKPRGFWSSNWGNRPEDGNRDIPPAVYAEWRDGKLGAVA